MTHEAKMVKTVEKDTKELILDAAEKLFAAEGFAAASLRHITAEAGVNLAAVNYHFGSKDALIDEVISRRLDPLNRERLQLLEELEASSGDAGPAMEQIVEAFIGPPLRIKQAAGRVGVDFMRIIGRVMSDPSDRLLKQFTDKFRETTERYSAAIGRAQPQLSPAEIIWRIVFMVGTMAHTMSMSEYIQDVSDGVCDPSDIESLIRRMTVFLSAGMRAAASGGDA
jgi:AcrR family transcriptional regulator